jgi:hypothetical protein
MRRMKPAPKPRGRRQLRSARGRQRHPAVLDCCGKDICAAAGAGGAPGGATAAPDAPAAPDAFDAIFDRLAAVLERLEALMKLTPAARQTAVRADASFHLPYLARVLMTRAISGRFPGVRGERAHDLRRADAAELALAVAESLPVTANPREAERADLVLAQALALCGRLWTQVGREHRAALHFEALGRVMAGRVPAPGRAELYHGVAQLRWRQGDVAGAVLLFGRAAELWNGEGRTRAAALALAQRGLARLDSGVALPELPAREELAAAYAQLRRGPRSPAPPALLARVAAALAYCETGLGSRTWGAELRREAAELVAGLEPGDGRGAGLGGGRGTRASGSALGDWRDGERLLLRWWDARFEEMAGRQAATQQGLNAIRLELLARGSLGEAVRVSLEQAPALVAVGKKALLRRLDQLGPDLVASFGAAAARRPAAGLAEVARLARVADLVPEGSERQAAMAAVSAARERVRDGLWLLRADERRRPPMIRALSSLAEEFLAAEESGEDELV